MALTEIEHESQITEDEYQIEAAVYSGFRAYNCPRDEVRAYELEFWTGQRNTWQPNPSLPTMPIRRVRVVEHDPTLPTFSRITAFYRLRNMYNPFIFPVNSTTIEVRGNSSERQILYAWDSTSGGELKICNGPDPSDPGRYFWKVIEGSDVKVVPNSEIILRTAILPANLNWPNLIALFGSVNSDTISALSILPRRLMFIDAYIPQIFLLGSDSDYIPIALGFRYEPSPGFLSQIEAQKFERVPFQKPIYAYNGGALDEDLFVDRDDPDSTVGSSDDAEMRSILVDRPVGDPLTLYTLKETAFSSFFDLTWWQ